MKAVVGRSRRSDRRAAAAASKRDRMANDAAPQQRPGGEADRRRCGTSASRPGGGRRVRTPTGRPRRRRPAARSPRPSTPGRHPLGPAGRPRRVVHGTGQRVGRQLGRRALVERGQGLVGRATVRTGSASASRRSRSAGSRVALSSTGTTPVAGGPEHGTEQVGRRRQAERHPVARAGSRRPPGAGRPALARLGLGRLEDLDRRPVRRHRGSVPTALDRTGRLDRRRLTGTIARRAAVARQRRLVRRAPAGHRPGQGHHQRAPTRSTTAVTTVTSRTPTALPSAPWTTRADRVEGPERQHEEARAPGPGPTRGPRAARRC